jgi:hypothetical protein
MKTATYRIERHPSPTAPVPDDSEAWQIEANDIKSLSQAIDCLHEYKTLEPNAQWRITKKTTKIEIIA